MNEPSFGKWTCIQDGLPEIGVPVLISRHVFRSREKTVDMAIYLGNGVWQCGCKIRGVTHWMPKPEPAPDVKGEQP